MQVSGSRTLTVNATAARCRSAAVDLGGYPRWYPGVSEAEVLAAEPHPRARLVFDAGIALLPRFACVLELRADTPHTLRVRVISGPMQVGGAGWSFAPQGGDCTNVSLELEVSMPVPGGRLAERALAGRARHFLIEEPVAALARHVAR